MSQLRGIKEGRKLFPANLLRLRDTRDTNGQIFHSFLGRDNHAIDFYTFLCNFYRNHRSSKLFPPIYVEGYHGIYEEQVWSNGGTDTPTFFIEEIYQVDKNLAKVRNERLSGSNPGDR